MALALSNTDYCLLAGMLLVFAYQVYFYCRYMGGVIRWKRQRCDVGSDLEQGEELPPVSIIVCARNEEANLQDYLCTLLSQDYPKFEVIVINDGSEDRTQEVLERYALLFKNLYVTFVPRETRGIGTKKLALTIGAKAAHYEYLLLTDADCRPESPFWVREMVRGFAPYAEEQTEIVLGYGAYFEQDTLLSSLICYDTLFSGMQYLGMAMAGHPYMGVGRNLAYKRATFFRHHGFRGLLTEPAGDDDLFVNKIATHDNTHVVCSPESITWSVPKKTWSEWLHQKRRHLSVSPNYKTDSKLRLVIEPMSRALFYGLLVASFVCGSGITCCVAYGLWLLRVVMQWVVVNIGSHRLGGCFYGIEIVLYDLFLPLLTLYIFATRPLHKHRMWYW